MDFRITADLPLHELSITPRTRMMLLGSCFAENVGKHFVDNKFCCCVNPFGVLYNPASLLAALQLLEQKTADATLSRLFAADGVWHSWNHHSDFSATSREDCEEKINRTWCEASRALSVCDLLFVTFGTRHVYRLRSTGEVVANCHKQPQTLFTEEDLTVGHIVEAWQPAIERLTALSPQMKILFTVSPYRYLGRGMHDNQLSKATLHLAIEALQQLFPGKVYYFPAYELLLDDLRDYRFYAPDMLHPSEVAVNYIWQCLSDSYFTPETLAFINAWSSIARDMAHRPFHPDSDQYRTFLGKIVLKIELLQEKYPNLALDKEKAEILARIQNLTNQSPAKGISDPSDSSELSGMSGTGI
jgi:hypothetical protein